MSSPSSAAAENLPAPTRPGADLLSSRGKTTIADSVVSKIAGKAAREVDGVHRLGGGSAHALGALRERIPGSGGTDISQGVSVEVGETQAEVTIAIVGEYGVAIPELVSGVRRNVIQTLQQMTGLQVVVVNLSIDDIHLPADDSDTEPRDEHPARVR